MSDSPKTGSQEKIIGLLVVVLLVAVGGLGYMYGQLKALGSGGGGSVANNQLAEGQYPAEEPVGPLTEDQWQAVLASPAADRGSSDAQVTLVEFTDYQCPFCARHFTETESRLLVDYIDTGKIRHIIRDLPLPFHPNAIVAAEAARCAGDQDKYWEMHQELFAKQADWSESTTPKTVFGDYATTLGLNAGTFNQCLDSGKYTQAVNDDLALSQSVGANGTPTFFINGEILVGAQPYEAFQAMIDAKL